MTLLSLSNVEWELTHLLVSIMMTLSVMWKRVTHCSLMVHLNFWSPFTVLTTVVSFFHSLHSNIISGCPGSGNCNKKKGFYWDLSMLIVVASMGLTEA
jgi:hypothetical protein